MNSGYLVSTLAQLAHTVAPSAAEKERTRVWATTSFTSRTPTPPISFNYDGVPSCELLKTWTREQTSERLDENRSLHRLTYSDPQACLQVQLEAIEYNDYPAVEWIVHFRNAGDSDTSIVDDVRALDLTFEREAPDTPIVEERWNEMAGRFEPKELETESQEFVVHYAEGSPPEITAFQPLETELDSGQNLQIGGYSSVTHLPFFNIEWDRGGMIAAIGWTGPWKADFHRDDDLSLSVRAGMSETHFRLYPGERIRMPRILVMFWDGDRIRGHNLWRRLLFDHYCRRSDGELMQVPMGAAAQWHTEEQNIAMIDWHLDNRLPIEYYWMDIGWHRPPTEVESKEILCDSAINEEMIPNGIRAISDHAHSKGIKYLLWFGGPQFFVNPERVRKNHPELLTEEFPGWDNGNPMINRWMVEYFSKLVEEWGIDIFRQDTRNYPLPDPEPDRVGINWARCVEGNYNFWDAMLKRFPNLLFDVCGGGGMNIDLESIGRCFCLHRSDYQCGGIHEPENLFNPTGMQGQTYGLSLWGPLTSGCCRELSLYALRSAYSPGLRVTFEAVTAHFFADSPTPPPKGAFDTELASKLMNEYKSLRHCFYGDYYPLTPYSLSEQNWMAWQFHRPDLGEGVIQAFRRTESDILSCQYKLHGLDPATRYSLVIDEDDESTIITGSELTEDGLIVTIPDKPSAAVITYKAEIESR